MGLGSATTTGGTDAARDVAAAVAESPFWYHTINVAPGVSTPGWFDLRPIADELPWPEIEGKRCLDIGTADGFLAFEMEKRGAAEVLAIDVADHELWDHPLRARERGPAYLRHIAGPKKGVGFEIARELLDSSVTLKQLSIYDLDPDEVGEFDVIVCGVLLLHLRDPLRALEAVRGVCRGQFMSTNQVGLRTSLLHRKTPLARLNGLTQGQWWIPNRAGHRQMLLAAGFDIDRETGLYGVPLGEGHPARSGGRGVRGLAGAAARRLVVGTDGVVNHAVLTHPAV
jgi:tRNA (mo5U34)-methyltransferase